MSDRIKILLVEDRDDDIVLAKNSMKKSGIEIALKIAKNGVEAVEYLKGTGQYAGQGVGHPDLILLDLKMIKLDGFEVLENIKDDRRINQIPVVILTTTTYPRDIALVFKLGAKSYMEKPINTEKFKQILKHLDFINE